MKPLSILTRPARTAGAVAAAGLRTTWRVVGWAVGQAASAPRSGSSQPTDTVTVPEPRPVAIVPDTPAAPKTAAVTKAPAKKAAAKKAPAKKAPSKKAAVLAPALGLTEDEVVARDQD